ncbi:DUF72 domain-containing protein [Paenibacillus sp. IB182496]|uniref:DUF72 domain-containing protein n=1 Tax=Paenibacillus sabuli TaxID=2772509 RepID=A0A927GSP8_9BACL|nr:DUF72 domain-containing protein [Paenibacillus sabuli]MBD2845912.1 DUF72 domain-containing protein [Paenibacillus sabuli]
MIALGLSGWGDHDLLYPNKRLAAAKLPSYAQWFPAVELDSSFYAVQPERNMRKWVEETPPPFRFLVKAYQGMTGHARGDIPFADEEAMYEAFRASLEPMLEADKLEAALFQYPPWFDCTRDNVALLRTAKARMRGIRCAIEFRHASWYAPGLREKTLAFLREEGWVHSVCDEPQVGDGSIPIVEEVTDDELTVVRFHGRNVGGWRSSGQPNWREVRYLYRYDEEELMDWAERLRRLERQSERLCVIFNNNSGGDAAANALQLMRMLELQPPREHFEPDPPDEEPPEQLSLF